MMHREHYKINVEKIVLKLNPSHILAEKWHMLLPVAALMVAILLLLYIRRKRGR